MSYQSNGGGDFIKEHVENIFELLVKEQQKNEVAKLIGINEKTEQFGLRLCEEEIHELMEARKQSLSKYQRIELGDSILPKVIFTFCDSAYLNQQNYVETLERLQDIFYEFKNEAEDMLTDDELLNFMREQFDGVCFGDLDYLEGTCLEQFAAVIHSGYRGYQASDGQGEYSRLDEVQRWDQNLYMEIVKELFW